MDFSITDLLTAIAVVAVVALMWLQQRNPDESFSVEDIAEAIGRAGNIWEDAQGYVAAAEQLWLQGRIEKDSRFNYVLDRLQATYPNADTDTLKNAIEAGVLLIQQYRQSSQKPPRQ